MSMSTITTAESQPSYSILKVDGVQGPVVRRVRNVPLRAARTDEVPTIDLSGIRGNLAARKALAQEIRAASESIGFFYIKNHGIDEKVIQGALEQAKLFFSQPDSAKGPASKVHSKYFNGWHPKRSTRSSGTESLDYKESFMWRYDPKFDPTKTADDEVPEEVRQFMKHEDFLWDGTKNLPEFQKALIKYWQDCLDLARSMVQIFALALDLPEDYFDKLTTYPGSDCLLNFYPGTDPEAKHASQDIGFGTHTDLQCFTLLWQDHIGGLQVLTNEGEWVKVLPLDGTLVVNIGDYLMRLSNDRFKSTLHRVYNRSAADRYSMPFFFGFNFNEKCGVLPSCVDASNPAKYEPISCGEWCQMAFSKQTRQSEGPEKSGTT